MATLSQKIRSVSAQAWIKTLVVLTGISLVPLIYAGALTWANEDPMNRMDTIPAAIVNHDEPTADLSLGEDLSETLLDNDSSKNFDWRMMDADEADDALADAEIYAVLEIPEDFSANAESLGDDDPQAATASQLEFRSNDATNIITGNMVSTVSAVIADQVRTQVSETYLDNIYVGFTTLHDKMGEAADGAGELADGTSDARDGSHQLVLGLNELASGSGALRAGAQQLDDGVASAHSGASELSNGINQLHDGAGELSNGASTLAGKLPELADGATSLRDGATTLDNGLAEANSAAHQLSGGLSELNTNVKDLPQRFDQLTDAAEKFADDGEKLIAGHTKLHDDLDTVTDSSADAATRLQSAKNAVEQAKSQSGALSETTSELVEGLQNWDSLSDAERERLLGLAQELDGGVSTIDEGLNTALGENNDEGLAGVVTRVQDIRTGADDIKTGLDRVNTDAKDALESAGGIDEVVAPVRGKLTTLTDAIAATDTGSTELAAGLDKLSDGSAQLVDGSAALADGANQASDGASTLADGAATLNTKLGEASSGATQLTSGLAALSNGAGELNAGLGQAQTGINAASDGAGDLESGLTTLNDGSHELSSQLADGADEVPSYTDEDREHLAEVSADPVAADAQRVNEVGSFGYGMAAYFIPLALWIGGLSFYLMFPALRARAVRSPRVPSAAVGLISLLPGFAMGAVQALFVWLIIRFGLDIEPANPWGLLAFMVLISLTFVAINQALVAILGSPGRFIGLILLVVQIAAAGGTYPVTTVAPFFQAIHPWLPMTHGVDAVRSLIAGSTYGVADGVLWLLVWFIGTIIVSTIAGVMHAHGLRETAEEVESADAVGVSMIEESMQEHLPEHTR